MLARSFLILLCLFATAAPAMAEPSMLDLISGDAVAGLTIRNLNDLKKKGDRFMADSELKLPIRPSQLFDQGFQFLGINTGYDPERPGGILIANPATVGDDKVSEKILELIVIAVPFTDRDKMAANFEIKAGMLKSDTMVKGKGTQFGTFFYARGNHVFFGNNEAAVASIAKGKSAAGLLSAEQRRTLDEAYLLLHFNQKSWGKEWKEFVKEIDTGFTKNHQNDEKVIHQLVTSLESVRTFSVAARVENGLGINLLATFPKDPGAETRDFLKALQGGAGASDLRGLPNLPIAAAQAARGDGAQNAVIAKLFVDFLLHDMLSTKQIITDANRANFMNVFAEVWKLLQGNRVAVYPNADPTKHGLFSVVGILDTTDPEKFFAELRTLARFADSASLDLSDKASKKDDISAVEKLIEQLGANYFPIRESATTKLSLIGPPVLPFLEKALKSNDAEVRRRAGMIKTDIVNAAEARRKELLNNNLTRSVQPTFGFAPTTTAVGGERLEVLRLKLGKEDAAAASQFQQLFGPDWDKIHLATHGKQVVVLLGSDPSLLHTTLTNLKENRPGLAESQALTDCRKFTDQGRKIELHISLEAGFALLAADDLKTGAAVLRKAALTSFSLAVDAQRLQIDVWLPSSEVKVMTKQGGF